MKPTIKSVLVLFVVVFLTANIEAHATSKQFLNEPNATFRFYSEIDYLCFPIPYTTHQLLHEWDVIMGMDIERIGRISVPYYLHNREIIAVRYFEHGTKSIVCYFYRSGIVFVF